VNLTVRLLREDDLPLADRIFRLAFGTFNGVPEPEKFGGDIDKIRTRWLADPAAAFGAEVDGRLVGSVFATLWGSVGYFGPLTVHPDFWDAGVGQRLLAPVMELFNRWGTRHNGLYTYSHSPKHLALYQKHGFWPRFLTAIMFQEVQRPKPATPVTLFSEATTERWEGLLAACQGLTDAIFGGLDVSREMRAVHSQKLGDTVLIHDGRGLAGFAVCHCGPGSEAGSGACLVKFAAVRPGGGAGRHFDRLLEACHNFAAGRAAAHLHAGVNTGRHEAYRQLLARGFRTHTVGVAMHRPNVSAYHHAGVYVIDDWR
jgi:predicted N-acetyltransferase YhbS